MLVAEGLQNSNLLFDGLAGLADKTDSLVDQHSESAGAQTLEPPKRVLVPQLQKDLITHDNFIDQKIFIPIKVQLNSRCINLTRRHF